MVWGGGGGGRSRETGLQPLNCDWLGERAREGFCSGCTETDGELGVGGGSYRVQCERRSFVGRALRIISRSAVAESDHNRDRATTGDTNSHKVG